jgi:AcrR family transcriptional regulator
MMNKTKRAIFESAIKVFSKSGYNGATVDDIAANAGVAKGTLYYHFKSKEEIFRFIITEGVEVIKEELENVMNRDEDAFSKLKNLCRVQLNLVYENKDFFKVIMSQIWGQELRQSELRDILDKYIQAIEEYVKEAIEAGVIKKGEPKFMAYTFFGLLCSAGIYELLNSEESNIDEVIDNLVMYILKGIQA